MDCQSNSSKRGPKQLWLILLAGMALFLYRSSVLIESTFGDIGVEQIVYHLYSPSAGVPMRLIKETLRELLFKPLLLMAILSVLLFVFSRMLAPFEKLATNMIGISAWALAVTGSFNLYAVTGIGDYIKDRGTGFDKNFDWFELYYTPPQIVFDNSKIKLNLIWIYVESLETRRTKKFIFQSKRLYSANEIKKFENLPGTGWTMGGIVSSQCGIPLMPVGLLGGSGLGDADNFLPNLQCLGDVLLQQNYVNEFIGGAETSFAGKHKFLKTHGFTVITGRKEINEITARDYPEDYWGYTDDLVLDLALQKAVDLHKSGEPFFLNVLTLNTHGPKGYLSQYCRMEGWTNDEDDIFDCALTEVGNFVEKLQSEGVLNNTVVVVSGDYPFMRRQSKGFFFEKSDLDRSVFFSVLRPDQERLQAAVMNHFDMLPTVLGALNFHVKDQSAGLGRNLFEHPSLSYTEEPAGVLAKALRQTSAQYQSLWRPRGDTLRP